MGEHFPDLEPILHVRIYSYNASVVVGYKSDLHQIKTIFILKTRHAISCAVNLYYAGVVNRSRRIGSWSPCSR
jgi:hypothetical protein